MEKKPKICILRWEGGKVPELKWYKYREHVWKLLCIIQARSF